MKRYTIEEIIALAPAAATFENAIKMYEDMRVHADMLYPQRLISDRRPNESEEVQAYRKKIYEPITANPINKVITSLSKIRRSKDWRILYDKNLNSKIPDSESLFFFCELNYPEYTSVTNWAFSQLLKHYLIDANAMCIVYPIELLERDFSVENFTKPIAEIIHCDKILFYKPNEYCVVEANEKTETNGNVYYVFSRETITKYEQSESSRTSYIKTFEIIHNFKMLSCFIVGGIDAERKNKIQTYVSRIHSMLPHLNEAAREYSDLQGTKAAHLFPKYYEYTSNECGVCGGKKTKTEVVDNKQCEVQCSACKGTGVTSASVYGKILVTPTRVTENQIPNPPFGYLQQDTKIIELQEQSVRNHLTSALEAINMEFLSEIPLSQSGLAKEVDKDELNNFVSAIAEDIVRIMDKCYFFFAAFRYAKILNFDFEKVKSLCPKIAVPERFDLLSSDYLLNEINKAKQAGVSPTILAQMQVDYALKVMSDNQELGYQLQAINSIDPLAGVSESDKIIRLSNGGISELDYVVSCNIQKFIQIAVELHGENFYTNFSTKEMRALIFKFAQDFLDEQSKKNEVLNQMLGGQNAELE